MVTLATGDTLDNAVTILEAISHQDRLQIVNFLMNGECSAGESAYGESEKKHL